MMITRISSSSKTIPGCDTIIRELTLTAIFFKTLERTSEPVVKLRLGNMIELRLRIMNVIDIDTLQIHVSKRLIELILKIRRRHAMTTADDVFKRRDTRLYESLVHVFADVARWSPIER